MGGGDTLFVPKIWKGLIDRLHIDGYGEFIMNSYQNIPEHSFNVVPENNSLKQIHPKLHTIRKDEKNLWVPGRKIHMVVFNRTKNRFQFAPVLEVKSIQHVKITYDEKVCEECCIEPAVFVNGKLQNIEKLEQLARNDGFKSAQQFCQWFSEDFTGKIIHWTNLKY